MATFQVPYSKEQVVVQLPDTDRVKVLEPNYGALDSPDTNEEEMIDSALEKPIGQPPLKEMLKPDHRVAIMVDDITRPTPTKRILPSILRVVEGCGVPKRNIQLVFALGSHRKMTKKEEEELLGTTICQEYKIIQHDCRDERELVPLDKDSSIKVNRVVYEAHHRILIGFIKSHRIAGYSGGSKSILPGVVDLETILKNHSYANLSYPHSGVGVLEGNPAREEMDTAARSLEPLTILNVVLNKKKEVLAAVSGDVIKAHRAGVQAFHKIAKIEVHEPADIVVVCSPHPADISLYQICYSGEITVKVKRPILKKGGVMILVGDCPDGLGDENFSHLLMKHGGPEGVIKDISRPNHYREGQWAAQGWADILSYCTALIVNRGNLPQEYFARTPMERAYTVEEAWKRAKEILKKERVLGYILPQAPETLPMLSKRD